MSLFLLALLACPPHPIAPVGPVGPVDPVALLARAAAEPPPAAALGTFDLRLDTADGHVSANGAVVVLPPNRFRIEVRGPVGPAQVVIVSDGVGLYAYVAGKNRFYAAPTADATTREATGGDAGLDALASLLLGRLPSLGPPDTMASDRPEYGWTGVGKLGIVLSPHTARLASLALTDRSGRGVLSAQVEGVDLPAQLTVQLPALGAEARVSFREWKPATPSAAAFVLTPPPGAEVLPLVLGGPVDPAP